jgi:Carboxypeptidase regulatory-like domain
MLRRFFLKIALIAMVISGLLAFCGVSFAQGSSDDGLARAIAAQQKYTDALMTKAGVVGTAVGEGEGAQPVMLVLLEYGGVAGIPDSLDGVPVRPLVTGKIYALAKPGGASASSTSSYWWSRPVPIGVSTGNANECAAGTISCRVTNGTNVYALSNNHVYARENKASFGEEVMQPGLYDAVPQCSYNSADVIGNLAEFAPIVFSRSANNVIDAAIASTTTSNLGTATPSGGYGTPSSTTATPALDMAVQKYGRTTGLTLGQVTGINATVLISYGQGKTARFVNQIIVTPGGFSAAGDSGSLIVTTDGTNSPVGLLFAGSSSDTIANPIDAVLSHFGVSIDSSSTSTLTTGSISGTVTDSGTGQGISGATVTVDTGQSATTDASGIYAIKSVPTGTHSVTASAAGYQSGTSTGVSVSSGQTTTGVDFSLTPASTATTMSVASITYTSQGGKTHDKNLSVTVSIVDNLGNAVGGASVSITLKNTTTSQSWSANGTTGSAGTATFTLNNAPSGTYTTTVNAVTAAGLTWDGIAPNNSYIKP